MSGASPPGARWWRRTGVAAFGVTAAGMVALPLLPRGRRAVVTDLVVAGLCTTTATVVAQGWGGRRAAWAAASLAGAGTAVEAAATATGWPFGAYTYPGGLRPTVVGVPVAVPAAWFAMAVPAREAAHAVLGRRSSPWRRVGLGAAALGAWDLFLDPQMTAEGYWRWQRPGRYRGIPLTNYGGWLVVGAAMMAALEVLLPPADRPDAAAVAVYAFMATMETLGFALFLHDPLVAVVGGAVMLPLAAAALEGVRRGRRAESGHL